jgi:hypothetical protein
MSGVRNQKGMMLSGPGPLGRCLTRDHFPGDWLLRLLRWFGLVWFGFV